MEIENIDSDLYDNLPDIGAELANQVEKLQQENTQLLEHIRSLEADVEKLCAKITEMKKIQTNLERNISELYKTAKLEIERKDRTISELRAELEQYTMKKAFRPFKRERDRSMSRPGDSFGAKKMKTERDESFRPGGDYSARKFNTEREGNPSRFGGDFGARKMSTERDDNYKRRERSRSRSRSKSKHSYKNEKKEHKKKSSDKESHRSRSKHDGKEVKKEDKEVKKIKRDDVEMKKQVRNVKEEKKEEKGCKKNELTNQEVKEFENTKNKEVKPGKSDLIPGVPGVDVEKKIEEKKEEKGYKKDELTNQEVKKSENTKNKEAKPGKSDVIPGVDVEKKIEEKKEEKDYKKDELTNQEVREPENTKNDEVKPGKNGLIPEVDDEKEKEDIIEKKQEKTLEYNEDITVKVVNNVEMRKNKHKGNIEDVTTKLKQKLEESPKKSEMSLSCIINDLHISNESIDLDKTTDLVCDTVTPENVQNFEIPKETNEISVVNTQNDENGTDCSKIDDELKNNAKENIEKSKTGVKSIIESQDLQSDLKIKNKKENADKNLEINEKLKSSGNSLEFKDLKPDEKIKTKENVEESSKIKEKSKTIVNSFEAKISEPDEKFKNNKKNIKKKLQINEKLKTDANNLESKALKTYGRVKTNNENVKKLELNEKPKASVKRNIEHILDADNLKSDEKLIKNTEDTTKKNKTFKVTEIELKRVPSTDKPTKKLKVMPPKKEIKEKTPPCIKSPKSGRVLRSATKREKSNDEIPIQKEIIQKSPNKSVTRNLFNGVVTVDLTDDEDLPVLHLQETDSQNDKSLFDFSSRPVTSTPVVEMPFVKNFNNSNLGHNESGGKGNTSTLSENSLNTSSPKKRRRTVVMTMLD